MNQFLLNKSTKMKTYLILSVLCILNFGIKANVQAQNFLQNSSTVYVDSDVKNFPDVCNTAHNVIQFISHGQPGQLLIDGRWMNAIQIVEFIKPMIHNKERTIDHINIYGCNFAQGNIGTDAVKILENELGISIAASTNITGKDGDWELEFGKSVNSIYIPNFNSNLSTFTVTNTGDNSGTNPAVGAGTGTLRQAIIDANANLGADVIEFNISGTAPHTITLEAGLPIITGPTTIDGTTQLGYVPNSAVSPNPFNGTITIAINANRILQNTFRFTNAIGITVKGICFYGVEQSYSAISLDGTDGANIFGNYFGILPDGLTLPTDINEGAHIIGQGTKNLTAGGIIPANRNIFALSKHSGGNIQLSYQDAYGYIFQGNYFGLRKDGLTGVPINTYGAINITNHPTLSNIKIGGATPDAGNVIANNNLGIYIYSCTFNIPTDTVLIQNNIIGTDYTGTVAMGNQTGIMINGIVNGKFKILDNLSSNNNQGGCNFTACTGTTYGLLLRNIFGLNKAGTIAMPNIGNALSINNSENGKFIIGDSTFANRNIFSGSGTGIRLYYTKDVHINYNFIGTNMAGTATVPNDWGIYIQANNDKRVYIAKNVIAGSVYDGINVGGYQAGTIDSIYINDNKIGVLEDGVTPAGNGVGTGMRGLTFEDGTIGHVKNNIIANNGGFGVRIGSSTARITISQNKIFNNGNIGIDLGSDYTVTPNDAGDADEGANNKLNFPVINSAHIGSLIVDFNLDVPAGNYRIEVFGIPMGQGDPTTYGEGNNYLGYFDITHPGGGSVNFVQTLAGSIPINVGDLISMTTTAITDLTTFGSTSEFSEVKIVTEIVLPVGLLSFHGSHNTSKMLNLIEWETASEINNKGFFLYKSIDGLEKFEKIATIRGQNISSGASYLYQDTNIEQGHTYFYKLSQEDFDGNLIEHDRIVKLELVDNGFYVRAFPNPSIKIVTVEVGNCPYTSNLSYGIYNQVGQEILQGHLTFEQGLSICEIDVNKLTEGIYVLRLANENGYVKTFKFLKVN
jgi:hypothetical protein